MYCTLYFVRLLFTIGNTYLYAEDFLLLWVETFDLDLSISVKLFLGLK